VAEAGADSGKLAAVMKWIGIAAALISFGSAVYGLLHAQADLLAHPTDKTSRYAGRAAGCQALR